MTLKAHGLITVPQDFLERGVALLAVGVSESAPVPASLVDRSLCILRIGAESPECESMTIPRT